MLCSFGGIGPLVGGMLPAAPDVQPCAPLGVVGGCPGWLRVRAGIDKIVCWTLPESDLLIRDSTNTVLLIYDQSVSSRLKGS